MSSGMTPAGANGSWENGKQKGEVESKREMIIKYCLMKGNSVKISDVKTKIVNKNLLIAVIENDQRV